MAFLAPESLYRLHLWLRSASVAKFGRGVFFALTAALVLWFATSLAMLVTERERMLLSDRIALEMQWEQQGYFAHPAPRIYLPLFAGFLLLILLREFIGRLTEGCSTYFCRLAADRGHDPARVAFAQYRVTQVGIPLEFMDASPSPWLFTFGVLWERLAFLDTLLPYVRRRWRAKISTPKQEKYLRQALAAFTAVTPEHELAGRACYWAGLISLRGLSQADAAGAQAQFDFAASRGVAEAAFELALLLLHDHHQRNQTVAHSLLLKALPKMQRGSMRDRALLELAKLEQVPSGPGTPNLPQALSYLTNILHSSETTGDDERQPETAGKPLQQVTPAELRSEARLMYQEIAARINTEAERKLTAAEREKREAVENMMAMFAHQFRGSVGTILFNAEHQHDERLYLSLARSMNGLLEMFSVVSTSPEKLESSLKADSDGEESPIGALHRALMLALVQLLTSRNRHRMSPHFLTYAKRSGSVAASVRISDWTREKNLQAREKDTQARWEAEIGAMLADGKLEGVCDWMAEHLLPIKISGFAESKARFAQFGQKASLLTVVLTEMLVNAIKHSATAAREAIEVTWREADDNVSVICANPSTKDSRIREASKGSGRGHKFLTMIADHLGGRFTADVFRDDSRVTMSIPRAIMTSEAK